MVERIKNSIDRHPVTILIVVVVFFLSSFFTIIQGLSWVANFYQNKINWRQEEYHKINSVRAGMNVGKFSEVFGSPTFTRSSKENLIENIYKKRDYWVQTISEPSSRVLLYSVTSCSRNFKPDIDPNPLHRKIVLNESTFESIGSDPSEVKYYSRVATANSYFYDTYGGGNPTDYKTVSIGINDVCELNELSVYPQNRYAEPINLSDNDIKKFRSAAKINTYSETAPFADQKNLLKDFQIGVDRIEVRPLGISNSDYAKIVKETCKKYPPISTSSACLNAK